MMYETMDKAEWKQSAKTSPKAKNCGMDKTPGRDVKKTVLRRYSELIENDFDSAEQRELLRSR